MKPLLVTLVLFTAVPAFAQQAPPQAPAASDTIVVTASAIPETVASTPASVTVVTREEIDEKGALDVADVLRDVPGLVVSRTGSPGKTTSLFIRGASSTQTLVLWNGIELNNPFFSGFDWGRFSTAGVEQVEIVRGPFSAIYGSDAVAGVVNVLTTPKKSELRGGYETGSHGLRNAELDGARVTQSMQLGGTFEHRQDDGFFANDFFRQNSALAFWKWSPFRDFSLGVSGRRTSYSIGIPFNNNADGSQLVPSPNRRGDGNERQLAIPIQQTIGRFGYEVTLSESRQRDDFTDPDDPFGLVDSTTRSSVRRARLVTHTATALGTIVAGGEYERATVDDRNNFGPNLTDDRRTNRSLFVEDRLSHDLTQDARLELSAGVRYDHFDLFGSQTSPRVAAAIVMGRDKFRAAYGEGFRAPSVGELFYPFSGNPNLHPETSRNFEAGYDYAFGRTGLLTATYFNSTYRDLIVFDPATFVFGNVGRAKSDGVEAGAQARLTNSLTGSISYTYLHKDEDSTTGKPLLRRPKHSGSASLGYRSGNLELNGTLLRTGRRDDFLAVAPFSRTINGAYTVIDANFQYHLGSLIPFVKVDNLRNERYEEVKGFRSPPRRASFGIRFVM